MSLDFGKILSRAWQLTWNNKILWLFGIFSALMAGGGGPRGGSRFDFGNPRTALPDRFQNIDQSTVWLILAGIAIAAIIIAIVLIILAVIGRGGLIGGLRLAETQGKVSFGEAFAIGREKFWTVLGLGLVVWVLGFLLAIMSLILFATICLAPLACVGFVLVVLLGVYARLAQIVAINDNVGLSEALSRTLKYIQANLGQLLVLGLILVVIDAVVGFLIFLPFIAIAAPVIFSMIGYANDSALAGTGGLVAAALCVVVYLPVVIVARGALESWIMACWTLAYRTLTGPAPTPAMPTPIAPMAA
jgi:hypothetical protein